MRIWGIIDMQYLAMERTAGHILVVCYEIIPSQKGHSQSHSHSNYKNIIIYTVILYTIIYYNSYHQIHDIKKQHKIYATQDYKGMQGISSHSGESSIKKYLRRVYTLQIRLLFNLVTLKVCKLLCAPAMVTELDNNKKKTIRGSANCYTYC